MTSSPLLLALVAVGIGSCGDRQAPTDRELVPEYELVEVAVIGGASSTLTHPGSIVFDPASGKLYVSQPFEHTVLTFEGSGEPLSQIGRRGAGPGEFQSVASVGLHGPFLYIMDPAQQRITFFRDEQYSHTRNLIPPPMGPPYVVIGPQFLLDDGAALTLAGVPAAAIPDGIADLPLIRFGGPEGGSSTIATIRTEHMQLVLDSDRGPIYTGQPLGKRDRMAVAKNGERIMLVASREDDEGVALHITQLGPSGDTTQVTTCRLEARPVTADDRRRLVSQMSDRVSRDFGVYGRSIDRQIAGELHFPAWHPPLGSVVATATNETWLEIVSGDERTWFSVDSTGQPRRAVVVPGGHGIAEAWDQFVWTVSTDAFGASVITMFRTRPGRPDDRQVPCGKWNTVSVTRASG